MIVLDQPLKMTLTRGINPVLSISNSGINAVGSGLLDISLTNKNMDEFNIKNKVGEETEQDGASSVKQENENGNFS